MPSGAKKRKAAKKKKGDHHNNNPNIPSVSTHSHGDENVAIKEGGEEQIEAGENVVRVERDIKIEEQSNKGNGGSSGSSGSNSSSNSDDESPDIKNTQALVEIASVLDSLNEAETIQHEPIKEASYSVVENIPACESDKIPLLVEKVEVDTSSVAPLVESVIEENGDKKTSSVEDKVGPSEPIVQSVEENVAILEPKECLVQEVDDKLTVSFNAPTITTDDDGAEREKASGVTEPLLAPRPVERTSWKGCCGLFDVFSGSRS